MLYTNALANMDKDEKKNWFWNFLFDYSEIMRRSKEDENSLSLPVNLLFLKKSFYFNLGLYFIILRLNLLHHVPEYNLKLKKILKLLFFPYFQLLL